MKVKYITLVNVTSDLTLLKQFRLAEIQQPPVITVFSGF